MNDLNAINDLEYGIFGSSGRKWNYLHTAV
jgi:hypothetical protein